MTNDSTSPPRQIAQTLDRGLLILELLVRNNAKLSISEIARELDVHRTIAHRLVSTLEARSYIVRVTGNKYKLANKLITLASNIDNQLRSIARPFLLALSREFDETVHIVTLEGTDVLFLDAYEGSKALRVTSRVGQFLPAHATSVGKAILATLTKEELKALYPNNSIAKVGPETLGKRSELFEQLDAVRESGYAVSSQESELGVGSVGVAIIDPAGQVQGAVSVAAPTDRLSASLIQKLAVETQKTAREIGELL